MPIDRKKLIDEVIRPELQSLTFYLPYPEQIYEDLADRIIEFCVLQMSSLYGKFEPRKEPTK
jgi:hypothetical protein